MLQLNRSIFTVVIGIFVLSLGADCDPADNEPTGSAPSADTTTPPPDTVGNPDSVDNPDTEKPPVETGPVAVASAQEGQTAVPQTALHLQGDHSYADGALISTYEWSVAQPAGSTSVFLPTHTFPNPTFEANVAGEYTFTLNVWDDTGQKSPQPMKFSVMVLPKDAIHVELLWHTPGDPDETDEGPEAGADMDLHFVHQYAKSGPDLDNDGAPDPWFDQPFDSFWFNPHPNWGNLDPTANDDPHLDRDDTDGAGPENLNMAEPEMGATYRIGAHYWHDHGYGGSLATVRIYILQELVYEAADVPMNSLDLWDVATIEWTEAGVIITPSTDKAGAPKISSNYQNPFFFQP